MRIWHSGSDLFILGESTQSEQGLIQRGTMNASGKTEGACAYCGRRATRGGMARHLRSCAARKTVMDKADAGPGKDETLIHLQVQDAHGGTFWLHLEMRGTATFPDGSQKDLLWIRQWDIRWQDRYRYQSPWFLPRGTRLSMRCISVPENSSTSVSSFHSSR